jgi:signal transduction histidine kinase
MKWLIPLGLVLLVIAYEIGPSRWVYERLGFTHHLAVEILLFGTVGPLLAYLLLVLLGRWIEEKETADFQANLLANAKKKEREVRQISDDTIQVLFATSLLITTFKTDRSNLPPNTATQIEITEQALQEAMQRLRSHLSS